MRSSTTRYVLPTPDALVPDAAYRRSLDYLYDFSRTPRTAMAVREDWPRKLIRTRALLDALGNPERAFESVLVAGTKGKGSTAALIESILRASGRSTGLYTQPHLVSWCERTRLGDRFIRPAEVVRLVEAVRGAALAVERRSTELGALTTFEVGTAVTFLAFARSGVELAVVEVGVGGAHDATNVLDPLLSVLTPISYDHTATLGDTLAEIASEKAGVFRSGRRAILGRQPPEALAVLERAARDLQTELERVGQDWRWEPAGEPAGCGSFDVVGPARRFTMLTTPLVGRHQRDNATLAIASALRLAGGELTDEAVRRGLAEVYWPGRIQVIGERPCIVLDGAHNAESAAQLAETLRTCFEWRRVHLIVGLSAGKDINGIFDALLPLADRVTLTCSSHERAVPPETIAPLASRRGQAPTITTRVADAVAEAVDRADPNDLICVTGSLFVVGDALQALGEP